MSDQVDDKAVQLTVAAPVQLDDFTLPAGAYSGVTRRIGGDSGGQMRSYTLRYFVVLSASDLASYGEPVSPDTMGQELDVTDLVGLGLITVE
jgi:hypothetical protein